MGGAVEDIGAIMLSIMIVSLVSLAVIDRVYKLGVEYWDIIHRIHREDISISIASFRRRREKYNKIKLISAIYSERAYRMKWPYIIRRFFCLEVRHLFTDRDKFLYPPLRTEKPYTGTLCLVSVIRRPKRRYYRDPNFRAYMERRARYGDLLKNEYSISKGVLLSLGRFRNRLR